MRSARHHIHRNDLTAGCTVQYLGSPRSLLYFLLLSSRRAVFSTPFFLFLLFPLLSSFNGSPPAARYFSLNDLVSNERTPGLHGGNSTQLSGTITSDRCSSPIKKEKKNRLLVSVQLGLFSPSIGLPCLRSYPTFTLYICTPARAGFEVLKREICRNSNVLNFTTVEYYDTAS